MNQRSMVDGRTVAVLQSAVRAGDSRAGIDDTTVQILSAFIEERADGSFVVDSDGRLLVRIAARKVVKNG